MIAADLAGNIKVWKYPGYKQVWGFEVGQDVLWLQWHTQAPPRCCLAQPRVR